jgi:hypothetical protein
VETGKARPFDNMATRTLPQYLTTLQEPIPHAASMNDHRRNIPIARSLSLSREPFGRDISERLCNVGSRGRLRCSLCTLQPPTAHHTTPNLYTPFAQTTQHFSLIHLPLPVHISSQSSTYTPIKLLRAVKWLHVTHPPPLAQAPGKPSAELLSSAYP